jgi:hypothetical protein
VSEWCTASALGGIAPRRSALLLCSPQAEGRLAAGSNEAAACRCAACRGVMVRASVAEARETRYRAAGRDCYLFNLDDQHVLDATQAGAISRFTVRKAAQGSARSAAAAAKWVEWGGG